MSRTSHAALYFGLAFVSQSGKVPVQAEWSSGEKEYGLVSYSPSDRALCFAPLNIISAANRCVVVITVDAWGTRAPPCRLAVCCCLDVDTLHFLGLGTCTPLEVQALSDERHLRALASAFSTSRAAVEEAASHGPLSMEVLHSLWHQLTQRPDVWHPTTHQEGGHHLLRDCVDQIAAAPSSLPQRLTSPPAYHASLPATTVTHTPNAAGTWESPQQSVMPYSVVSAPPLKATIFIGQLSSDATEADIRRILGIYGDIVDRLYVRKADNNGHQRQDDVRGCTAYVSYATAMEADAAIIALHGKYCMDERKKPVQVAYSSKTDIISDFGFDHAVSLHLYYPSANPIPVRAIPPRFTPNASGRCSYWDAANSHNDLEGCAVVCFSTDAATVREMNLLAGYTYSSVHEGAGVTTVNFVSTGEADRAIRAHHGAAATGGAPLRVSYDYAATAVISDFGFDHFMFLGQQDAARRRLEDPKHKWMLGPGELPPRLQKGIV